MWPPSSEDCLFARTTIAMAFQRTSDLMLFSSSASPGDRSSWVMGMVFMYAVLALYGI